MKQTLIGFGAMLSMFFQACNSQMNEPTQSDILGNWVSSDGAMLEFNKDSSFIGKSLPDEYFTFALKKDAEGKRVSGSGKWELEKGQGFKEVKLTFIKMKDEDIYGFYSILVSGENGILDNKPPWYLFEWKEEEGGERYEFIKQ